MLAIIFPAFLTLSLSLSLSLSVCRFLLLGCRRVSLRYETRQKSWMCSRVYHRVTDPDDRFLDRKDHVFANSSISPLLPLSLSFSSPCAIFSFLYFILRLSGECIADASRWKIFIGTRARSYVGNVNHKRRLRENSNRFSRSVVLAFYPFAICIPIKVKKKKKKTSECRALERENLPGAYDRFLELHR